MDDPKKPQLLEVKVEGFEKLNGDSEKPETPKEEDKPVDTEIIDDAAKYVEKIDNEFDGIVKFLNDYKAAEGTEAKKQVINNTTLKPETLKDLGSLVGSVTKIKGLMDKETPTDKEKE